MQKTGKYYHFKLFFFVLMCVGFSFTAFAQSPAFPGAEGYGKYTTGGRGGEVIYVSNLNDSGPGSFRDAVTAEGKRTVVFEISGTIQLKSPVIIHNGDLTIAGQSAPGEGITIRDYPVELDANNIIIRYIRFRLGDEANIAKDAFSATGVKDIIVDHCTMSWGVDETASMYRNQNFTLQWSIISESLANSVHPKGRHGYGGIWGGQKATFHHNLIAHHTSRNPRFADSAYDRQPTNRQVDFYNNVLYNWKFNSIYGGEMGEHNIINNYFKAGPATDDYVSNRILNPSKPYGKFFVRGNVIEGFPDVSENNWEDGIQSGNPGAAKAEEPFQFEKEIHSADSAYLLVLKNAGASLNRDVVDERIIKEVQSGTATYTGSVSNIPGIIDSQNDVGGWPELEAGKAPLDSDRDGMPDFWETENGLNPNSDSDAVGFDLHSGYTNVEVYLNSLVK